MSFSNPKTKQLNLKIIYFGPASAGKSVTLNKLHQHYNKKKNKPKNLSRQTEQAEFFDFLPLSLGKVGDEEVRLHVYAIPGPIFFEASRRLLLTGIDGIVFVADSRLSRLEENLVCLQGLEENLRDQGIFMEEIPLVFQYNKRDLAKEIVPLNQLDNIINPDGRPAFESAATQGNGISEPLEALTKKVLSELHYPE